MREVCSIRKVPSLEDRCLNKLIMPLCYVCSPLEDDHDLLLLQAFSLTECTSPPCVAFFSLESLPSHKWIKAQYNGSLPFLTDV